MTEKIKFTVQMEVGLADALTLREMFNYWNLLSKMGGSREVGFYVDGDGDFHPKCKITTNKELPEISTELAKKAIVKDEHGNRVFDSDPLAWGLDDD